MTIEQMPGPDAIVIGSGFGGAVAACRLAESGRKVLVLERGPYRKPEDFPRLGSGLGSWLWNGRWNGFFDLRMFRRIATLTSSGVGGGSHAYANVHLRAPQRSFREGWPSGYGPETLDPHYARVEKMLGVRAFPETIHLEKTSAYHQAATRLGDDIFRPNLAVYFGDGTHPDPAAPITYDRDPYALGVQTMQAPCRMCGECDTGCKTNSKNTLDLNYLAVATQRHGAVISPLTEVVAIRPRDGGYRLTYRKRDTGEAGHIWAPLVVLAAGTVNTNELLLRARDEYETLPGLSPHLGRHFSGNGDFLAAAVNTREPLNGWHGPTITLAARFLDDKFHFYLEEGGFTPDLSFFIGAMRPSREYISKFAKGPAGYAARLSWFYKEVSRLTGDNAALEQKLPSRTIIFLGMGEDGSDGRLYLRKRLARRPGLDIAWSHDRTRPLIGRMETELKRITGELGGEYVTNPLWSLLGRLITVHPLGGAAISDDKGLGVLNPYGEVWGYPNLFVTDGAAIPRGIGPNPSLTISAIAERAAEYIVKRG
ncbi:MAG: GMC oxidoreductase [Dehalococcoidia bacterium]